MSHEDEYIGFLVNPEKDRMYLVDILAVNYYRPKLLLDLLLENRVQLPDWTPTIDQAFFLS